MAVYFISLHLIVTNGANAGVPSVLVCTGDQTRTIVKLKLDAHAQYNVLIYNNGIVYKFVKQISVHPEPPGTRLSGGDAVSVPMDDSGGFIRISTGDISGFGWMTFKLPDSTIDEGINCVSKGSISKYD
jgi:hypothetical protein